MSGSITSRLCSLATAAWFAALATELPPLHTCAVHDAAAHGAPATSAGHDHSGGDGHHKTTSHHGAQCTCPGLGCCGAATTLPATIVAGVVAASLTELSAPAVEQDAPRASATQFLLPPAIGPPALHTSLLT